MGEPFDDYFKKHKFSFKNAANVYELFSKLALSIGQLHDKNILHCDISLRNFLVKGEGDDVVTTAVDLGSAEILENGQTEIVGPFKGNKVFVAPEVLDENDDDVPSKYSKAADVYALGKMFKDFSEDIEPYIYEGCRRLVERMTDSDPTKRPSMKEVSETFMELKSNSKEIKNRHDKMLLPYRMVDEYIGKKGKKGKLSWFFSGDRIKRAKSRQIDLAVRLAVKLKETLAAYDTAIPGNDKEKLIDKTVDKILFLMKENQNLHEKEKFPTESKFNIEILQNLHAELREGICKKLGIPEDSDILKEVNYSTRDGLAEKISKYSQSVDPFRKEREEERAKKEKAKSSEDELGKGALTRDELNYIPFLEKI